MKFEDSPESQEYIKQLEAGQVKLPEDSSAVEKTALAKLKDTTKTLRELAQRRAATARQIEQLKQLHFNLGVDEDRASGTLSGYAILLATVEGERRALKASSKKAAKPATPKAKPATKVAAPKAPPAAKVVDIAPKAKAS
jgi:hypothetical protein